MVKGATVRLSNLVIAGVYTLVLMFGILPITQVRADAAIAYSSGTVAGIVEDEIDLGGITVSGTDPTIPLVLDIDDSDGILYMTDTTNVNFVGTNRGSRLSFSGSAADLNNALATLKYRTLSAGSYTLTATIIGAGVVYFPGNGHMYEAVYHGSGLDWNEAQTQAAGRTMNGATGYLATVTTQAENDYLVGRLQGDGWFGASDAATEGDWQWVTGPESGTSFWAGLSDGAPVSGRFSNWSGGEPNNSSNNEDCSIYYSDGSGWNDLDCSYSFNQYYVVEYGGPGDLPTPPESVNFAVNVAETSSDVVPIGSCLDLLDVADNPELDNRYDTLSLTANIDCAGESLAPMFSEEDIDFGTIGYRGTFEGNGFTISNIDINDSSDDVGLFSATNGAAFENFTIGGSVVGDYCVGGLVGDATNTSFLNVNSTISVEGYGEVGGLVGCYDAKDDSENMFDNVTVTNTVRNNDSSDTGGFIGTFDAEDNSLTTIEDSSAESTFITTNSRVGGLIGELDLYDNGRVDIQRNTIDTVDTPDSSTVGGVIGEVDAKRNQS